jgi:molybdopterin-binding protein
MSPERVRIEVAFDGGQIMGALVTQESADALEQALGNADAAALSLEAEDGRYTVALQRVVYVKRFARESRVGFGSATPS